jgi:hypothetical protein
MIEELDKIDIRNDVMAKLSSGVVSKMESENAK